MAGKLKKIRIALVVFFSAVLLFSTAQVILQAGHHAREASVYRQIEDYAPTKMAAGSAGLQNGQWLSALQKHNPDIAGWLWVQNTAIDYPFVQTGNNDDYLRKDLNNSYALAGSLFVDYRCKTDFTGFNTIVYGHNMKNGSMFGCLRDYQRKDYLTANRLGSIFLAAGCFEFEIFACLDIRADDPVVYSTRFELEGAKQKFLSHIKNNAVYHSNIPLTEEDRFITFSTCSDIASGNRLVVIAKLLA